MVRRNYPFNNRDDKKMTNLVSSLITGIIFAPFLLFSSSKDKDLDSIEVIVGGILLLPFILLTPSIWNVLCGFDFITRIMLLIWIYILIGCRAFASFC